MALRTVPPVGTYDSAGNSPRRLPQRSFAELYRQAREGSINDNGASSQRQDRNAANDDSQSQEQQTAENRAYIATLHDRVDTLRGELLVRVIQSGADLQEQQPRPAADISRLATRLDSLRQKLQDEESRLSGKLFNVEI